uniref:G protein-coupled receptor n=1 Tax=Steinernema glaseri TaxID=37863 RepID=A0A1I7YL01_9BILA
MEVLDVVAEHQHRYAPYRYIIIANAILAVPLNILAAYLIIFKSPKNLKTYRYILLNITFWVFLTDVMVEIFFLPQSRLEIFAVYATGLASSLSPECGFILLVLSAYCFGQYLVALLFAFFYRYQALRQTTYFCCMELVDRHFWVAIAALMIVPPGTILAGITISYSPYNEFKTYALQVKLAPYFGAVPIFGVDKTRFLIGCGTILIWAILWIIAVALCIRGIVNQFRAHRAMFSEYTYRLHMQLMKALVVQTAAPLGLFVVPLAVDMVGLIFLPNIMNDAIVLTELALSLHSTVNSVAVIVLIAPYRKAAVSLFYKVYSSHASVAPVHVAAS